ncbi:hypothetical protein N0V95_000928 [Ascochyta clinopodiicola]|nr:hypothetical protein N0V95_000928 [Ascochyta clinopodiicola]
MSSIHSNNNDTNDAPQEIINEFWENLITKKPGKVTKIFPPSLYANLLPPQRKSGLANGKNAAESYGAAAQACRARVERIVRECERTNEKFTDPDFDIEVRSGNCLNGLMQWYEDSEHVSPTPTVSPTRLGYAIDTIIQAKVLHHDVAPFSLNDTANVLLKSRTNNPIDEPGAIHRVDWIFDKPKFEIEGFTSSDVVQGANGDCWFIAALATVCSNQGLIQKVCVARDERCGVYGFAFHRDGEWIWTVVDDNLFVTKKDFDARGDTYDPTGVKENMYKKTYQTGSEALYFASCAHENETWLPLLEKAYAKVHGDYDAISGGISGEAVEDLTGGVTSKILTARVLDKERLWKELKQVNIEFLFSVSSPEDHEGNSDARRGLALGHAYSIINAVDATSEDNMNNHQLVLVRNPWGKRANAAMGEWTGPWSDGSSEWTPYWMEKLKHKFGDDGLFWMSYEDLLKRFDLLDRTRLFDSTWTVVQNWISVSVAWVTGYLNTKFSVEIKKKGMTVFQLCQLDDRYFRGLTGKYTFDLHFILQEKDAEAGDYIARARGAWFGNRSISAEVVLEPGVYEVLPKIEAKRNSNAPEVHEVVTMVAERNPQKLRQIGLNYDIANAKGLVELTAEEDQRKKTTTGRKKTTTGRNKEEPQDIGVRNESVHTVESVTNLSTSMGAQSTATAGKNEEIPFGTRETKPIITTVEAELFKKTAELDVDDTISPNDGKDTEHTCNEGLELHSRVPSKPAPRARRSSLHLCRVQPVLDSAQRPQSPADRKQKAWNAVCTLGLRVYSQDPGVSIKILKPKNVEEGAILDVNGDTAAGATM